ncbi:MAG: 3-hydroxyacyl-CoA dehydrogenase NAD-binding domain-containing protein [Spongiibacteraceae bacterium]
MTEPVIYEKRQNVALILLNNPPINALSTAVRIGIERSVRAAIADQDVIAVVIASLSQAFCGGADISEFSSANFGGEPSLPNLLNELEKSPKPIIAAVDGVALGGGMELVLACDYCIATPASKFGLPEIHLGIFPGAGGTQRLPRIAGVEIALDMMLSGTPISASKALMVGVINQLHEGKDLHNAAISYAKELVLNEAPLRDCAELTPVRNTAVDEMIALRKKSFNGKGGNFAAIQCIAAVEAACTLSLSEGLKKEAELFLDCMKTAEARALQHLFFAERAANKIPGINPKTPARNIQNVAIIGAGTMGGGIAMNFINAGIPTKILDLNGDALERGLAVIRNNYEISAKKGRLTDAEMKDRLALLTATTSYDDIADADLVIEAVFEKIEIKKVVFEKLDKVCKPGAILATNTSTLDVNAIAAITSRPQDVIGLHFFSPANVMKLLEIVRAETTADDVIVTALKMAKRIGKLSIVVGVCFGFVGNRMLEPYGREAMRLVLEGASPAQVDRVLTEFGLAMGLCAMSDLAGIDIGYLTRQSRRDQISHDPSYAIVADRLCEQGNLGQKSGSGFYLYNGRERHDNPQVLEIAKAAALELGIEQREISDQEILERCLFPLINEGARIVDEGIAYRASDCDLIYINGYGFPRWRGGPMQYADEIGLDNVLQRMNHYRESLGAYGEMWFQPASLMEKLADEGQTFKQFDAQRTEKFS